MRERRQLNVSYSNDEYMSIFLGICKSEELLEEYLDKDYDLLEDDYIGFEMGVDFGINTYDEDFMLGVLNAEASNSIDEIFKNVDMFDVSKLKEQYPNELEQAYNTVIIIGRMKYEGNVKEVSDGKFGYFKFFGIFEDN